MRLLRAIPDYFDRQTDIFATTYALYVQRNLIYSYRGAIIAGDMCVFVFIEFAETPQAHAYFF